MENIKLTIKVERYIEGYIREKYLIAEKNSHKNKIYEQ